MKIVTDKKGCAFQFRLPGFKYDDFDRAGNLSLYKLNRMVEVERYFVPDLLGHASKDRLFVQLGSHWLISKKLYSSAAINMSLLYDWRLTHVGRTSIDFSQRLFQLPPPPNNSLHLVNENELENVSELKEKTPLSTRIARVVSIDSQTRKSLPFPDQIREEFHQQMKTAQSQDATIRFPEMKNAPIIPADPFITTVATRYDDTDMYEHTNQGAYLSLVHECAARAINSAFYKQFNTDICFYRVCQSTGVHLGESFAGEELQVITWEEQPMTLNFVVKRAGRDIYYCRNIYFNDDSQ